MARPAKVNARAWDIAQFWMKVSKKETGCWEFNGTIGDNGYGRYTSLKPDINAHRIAYKLLIGDIPPDLQIDHLCRNRKCVSPDHLELVTTAENILRGAGPSAQNARKTHCIRGHAFSGRNVWVQQSTGYRQCKACMRLRKLMSRGELHRV